MLIVSSLTIQEVNKLIQETVKKSCYLIYFNLYIDAKLIEKEIVKLVKIQLTKTKSVKKFSFLLNKKFIKLNVSTNEYIFQLNAQKNNICT